MRAWQYHGAHDLRLVDVPEPSPGPGEVLVRPAFNGLCGTDVHQWVGGALAPVPLPIGVGHESSGVVVAIGADVAGVTVGDAVAVEPVDACGTCRPCARGWRHLCQRPTWFGLTGPMGGLSDLAVVTPEMVHRLPAGVDLVAGALVEPLSVAHHAVELGRAQTDELVVVFGAGPIGIGCVLALRAHGVERIVVVEPAPARRAAIASLGATHVVDPDETDPREVVAELGGRDGADVVIDAAGVEAVVHAGLDVLGARGRLVLVAAHTKPVTIDLLGVLMREVRLQVSFASCGDFPRVLDHLAAGEYRLDSWVERVPFEGLVDALERLHAGTANKVLVEVCPPP
jgi:(R,R)-butanediol dehydrogenase / meso-butanediol dehydrogenase / diacetyl reductase